MDFSLIFVGFFAWWWWVCCRGGVSGCGSKGGFHLFGFLPWGGGVAVVVSLVVVANVGFICLDFCRGVVALPWVSVWVSCLWLWWWLQIISVWVCCLWLWGGGMLFVVFIWVLIYIILLCKYIILISRIEK